MKDRLFRMLPRGIHNHANLSFLYHPKPKGVAGEKIVFSRSLHRRPAAVRKPNPRILNKSTISIRIEAPCFYAIHSPLGPRILTLFPAPPPLFDVCCLSSEGTPYQPQSSFSFSHSVHLCFVHGGNLTSSRCPATVRPARS